MLLELDEDELMLLDLPPMLPGLEEVDRLVTEPVDEEVFGRTVEPATCLFWKVLLEYVVGVYTLLDFV